MHNADQNKEVTSGTPTPQIDDRATQSAAQDAKKIQVVTTATEPGADANDKEIQDAALTPQQRAQMGAQMDDRATEPAAQPGADANDEEIQDAAPTPQQMGAQMDDRATEPAAQPGADANYEEIQDADASHHGVTTAKETQEVTATEPGASQLMDAAIAYRQKYVPSFDRQTTSRPCPPDQNPILGETTNLNRRAGGDLTTEVAALRKGTVNFPSHLACLDFLMFPTRVRCYRVK